MSNQLQRLTETTVQSQLAPKREQILQLIGENNYIREVSFAIQAANSNKMLSNATPVSVSKAVFNVAITGLSLNPVMKLAYLTPRMIDGEMNALLMPSYMGLCKLVTDTGSVTKIEARIVFDGDVFEVNYGTNTEIVHKPAFVNKTIKLVYAMATLPDGTTQFEIMTVDEINAIRERSDGYKAFKAGKVSTAIWETDYNEMAKKTVIKRLVKYLPKSINNEKWQQAMQAVDLDNKEYPATDGQVNYIENLLANSTYDDVQRAHITAKLGLNLTSGDAEKIIEDLQMNQLAIVDKAQISVSDAKEAVAEKIN